MTETGEETYSLAPVEECAIHPLAKIRFDYTVDELVDSIAAVGQVQPGKALRVAEHGSRPRYLVYIGCRRLIACEKAGVKLFKALVVNTADDSRIQRELLTENMKRANLSVLEELNLLANYSKSNYSLNDLARDIGFSPRLVRGRVNLAIQLQSRGLIETFYKIERVSGFRFTHRHIEEIAALEEGRWLPISIQAAEHNWRAEQIGTLGVKFGVNYLIDTLPGWGRQFVKQVNTQTNTSFGAAVSGMVTSAQKEERASQVATVPSSGSGQERPTADSYSRYQTVTDSSRYLVCPKCGSESPVESPTYPSATRFVPGKANSESGAVPLQKEPIPLVVALSSLKCVNKECGRTLIFAQDLLGDGQPLLRREELLSLISSALEPEDGGVGSLVWDGKEEVWLKVRWTEQGEAAYLAYDERVRRWVIPVKIGEQKARVPS